jgi:hypothetical protein
MHDSSSHQPYRPTSIHDVSLRTIDNGQWKTALPKPDSMSAHETKSLGGNDEAVDLFVAG